MHLHKLNGLMEGGSTPHCSLASLGPVLSHDYYVTFSLHFQMLMSPGLFSTNPSFLQIN